MHCNNSTSSSGGGGGGGSGFSSKMSSSKILPKQSSIDMDDLIHLPGPLTEDAVMRTLNARFNDNKYFVSIHFFYNVNIFKFT